MRQRRGIGVGKPSTNVAPPAGAARPRPGRRSPRAKPRAIARPSPLPARARRRARTARRSARGPRGDTGAVVATRSRTSPLGRGRHVDGVGRRRELERVLEQVDERALDLRRVDADRRQVAGSDESTRSAPARALERPRDAAVDGPELRLRRRRRPRAGRGRAGSRRAARGARLVRIVSTSPSRSDASGEGAAARLSLAARIAVSGERRSWLTACRIAVLTASLWRSVSASTALRASRRERVASSLTTAVTDVDRERDPVDDSCSASVCTGGRKKKLNVNIDATETGMA